MNNKQLLILLLLYTKTNTDKDYMNLASLHNNQENSQQIMTNDNL